MALILLGWQLVFWPMVHLAEKAARPPGMDARPAVEYQLLDPHGAARDGGAVQLASRNEAPVAYYVKSGSDAPRVRFRIPFEVDDPQVPRALFLGVRNSVDVVRINGQLAHTLSSLPRLEGLVTSEPAYLPLPAERLHAGRNLLEIETPNFGSQWLAEFAIGPRAPLADAFRWKSLLQTDVALMGLAILVFTILLCGAVRWPPEDRPRVRALVTLLATCAGSTYLLTFNPPVPLSVAGTVFFYTLSNCFIATAVLQYLLVDEPGLAPWRARLRWAWLVAPLLCGAGVLGADWIGPAGTWLSQSVKASFWVVILVGALALLLLARVLVRDRGARWFERSMLALCLCAFIIDRLGSVVPLYSPFDPSMQLTLGWSQIVGGLLGLSMVVALAREATEARRTVQSANLVLRERLAQREAELRAVHLREQASQRRAVLLEERQRLVRDMHDGIGGQLLGLAMQARGGASDPKQMADGLEASLLDLRLIVDAMDTAEQGLAESVDAFAHRVRPQAEAAGVALRWLNQLRPGEPRAGSRATLHLLRALQEAVANALRHAGASVLQIEARREPEGVVLQVGDNGRGLAAGTPQGRGLQNLRARVAALGGRIDLLEASPGLLVRITVPEASLDPSLP